MLKTCFVYDNSGYFVRVDSCQESPLEPGVFLMPPNATMIEPTLKADCFYRWNGSSWIEEKKPSTPEEFEGLVVDHYSQNPHDVELRALIQKACPADCTTHRLTRGNNLEWMVERIPEKTEEEKLAEAEQAVRAKRDALLAETDFLMMSDYPLGEEDAIALKTYRQELRDVPTQEGFPSEVAWPELPATLSKKVA